MKLAEENAAAVVAIFELLSTWMALVIGSMASSGEELAKNTIYPLNPPSMGQICNMMETQTTLEV